MTRKVTEIAERSAIADVITMLFVETDERNWPGVLLCLAPRVRFNLRFLDGNPELEADAAVPQSVHA